MLKTWYFPNSAFWSTGQLEGLQPPPPPPPPPRSHWLRYWFHASILLVVDVELVRLWCINFISVKLFECYYGPLVRCVDTCWCYLKGDVNCNYYYNYYCSSVQREQPGAYLAPPPWVVRIVKLLRKVSEIEACPPPPFC